jgi:hypothetical protein
VVGAVRTPGSLRHAGVALTVAVLAAGLLAPGSVLAAKKERVAVSIPDEGQLAAARLGFKVKGTAKPKVKVKLANADELHPDIVIAAQVAREKSKRGKKKKGKKRKKKGRAAVLLAIGNVPGAAASGRDRRVTVTGGERAIVEVASANQAISSLRFDDLPTSSRTFLSVLGAEPAGERQLAQDTFDIDYEDFEEIPYTTDGLELLDLMTAMGLSRVNDAEVITSDTVAGLFPDRAIAAAIAAALGPPATLDAKTYNVLSGRPFPLTLTYQHVPASNRGCCSTSRATAHRSPAHRCRWPTSTRCRRGWRRGARTGTQSSGP